MHLILKMQCYEIVHSAVCKLMMAFKKNTNPVGHDHNEISQHSQSSYIGMTSWLISKGGSRGTDRFRWPRSHSWKGGHLRGWGWDTNSMGLRRGCHRFQYEGLLEPHGHTPSSPKQHETQVRGLWTGRRGKPPRLAPGPPRRPQKVLSAS